jgi:hypothetical protein
MNDKNQEKSYNLLLGNNPSSLQRISTIAQSEASKLEKVVGRNFGSALLRKTRIISGKIGAQNLKLSKREAEFLFDVDHEAFPKMDGYFVGKMDGKFVTVTSREYVPGIDLESTVEKAGRIGSKIAISYVSQIVEGLNQIHKRDLLFRDLKPSNLIVKENSETPKNPYGTLKFTDLDSLGHGEAVVGVGGSTFGMGTVGWSHPNHFVPGLAKVQDDYFAVGTSLYFMLTGKQARFAPDISGGVTLNGEDLQYLEDSIITEEGGIELSNLVKKLVSPRPENQYKNATEISKDLSSINTIFNEGYGAVRNRKIIARKKDPFRVLEGGIKSIFNLSKIGLKAAFATPLRIGLVAGTALGIGTATFVSDILETASAERAIYFAPEIAEDESYVVQVSAGVNNISAKVGGLYVQMHMENRPNDIAILGEVREAMELVEETREDITGAVEELQPLSQPIGKINSGGTQIKSSFSHRASDNSHEECSTSTDGEGNETETCWDVYDDTDHYWNFDSSLSVSGFTSLVSGLDEFDSVKPVYIVPTLFEQEDVPKKDLVGREVVDSSAYLSGQNEWLEEGLLYSRNHLTRPSTITGNQHVIQLSQDMAVGIHNQKAYPKRTHENNTCSAGSRGCDEKDAPRGYVTIKHASVPILEFARNYHRMTSVLSQTPGKLAEVEEELKLIESSLLDGKNVSEKDFRKAGDRVTELYQIMVPNSSITAPTSAERAWKPIAAGMGVFILLGAIGGGISYTGTRRRRYYY